MQKILSAEQMRSADQYTIVNEPIASIDLMERAAMAFVKEFEQRVDKNESILIVCGCGNNGGDGLAIARMLKSRQYQAKAILVKFSSQLSADCKVNLERLGDEVTVVDPTEFAEPEASVIVDAIFGSGLNRPITGELGGLIQKINDSGSKVFSVDIPSGLFADELNFEGEIIKADCTITFQRSKLSFLVPETGAYVGKWLAVDIGLNRQFMEKQQSDFYLLDSSVRQYLKPRNKFQHKGDFGRVQVFAGSLGKMGAAFLCAKATFKAGAGLVTAHVPRCGMEVLQTSLPEAMLTIDKASNYISELTVQEGTDVVCIGPGIGLQKETVESFRQLLLGRPKKLVVDADGLNILSQQSELMDLLPEGAILTPHLGEFHRLFGQCADGFARIRLAQQVAVSKKLIIVIKGAHTAVICPDKRVYFNNTGNPGMATAGSGDVLAGLITGFLAQGLTSAQAACLGVYIHGKAGDLAEKKLGEVPLMASDLLRFAHKAISNV